MGCNQARSEGEIGGAYLGLKGNLVSRTQPTPTNHSTWLRPESPLLLQCPSSTLRCLTSPRRPQIRCLGKESMQSRIKKRDFTWIWWAVSCVELRLVGQALILSSVTHSASASDGTKVGGWAPPIFGTFARKLWSIRQDGLHGTYTIRNLAGGTYLDLHGG